MVALQRAIGWILLTQLSWTELWELVVVAARHQFLMMSSIPFFFLWIHQFPTFLWRSSMRIPDMLDGSRFFLDCDSDTGSFMKMCLLVKSWRPVCSADGSLGLLWVRRWRIYPWIVSPLQSPLSPIPGVDYFSLILVKWAKCQVKRYGALFTCLVSRAVHIEMAASLDTPSFINMLRRFVAQWGQVKLIRYVNGTNLVGAQRELRQAIQEWNQAQVEAFLLQKEVTWCFNAPSASHHGGAWERLIQSTRRILLGLTREQVLGDDRLSTFLAEVELVLNGRPLTKSSSDPQDLTCLTPNHLLLLKDQPSLPPGMFPEADNYVRRRWRQIQYLSNLFWKQWVAEYLTVLQDRQKWLFPKWNVQVNDVVLIVDQETPQGSWLLGRVIETYPDKTGYVRNVAMKTRSSRLVRTVSKLVMVLECDE